MLEQRALRHHFKRHFARRSLSSQDTASMYGLFDNLARSEPVQSGGTAEAAASKISWIAFLRTSQRGSKINRALKDHDMGLKGITNEFIHSHHGMQECDKKESLVSPPLTPIHHPLAFCLGHCFYPKTRAFGIRTLDLTVLRGWLLIRMLRVL
jgi:hypothetical protein